MKAVEPSRYSTYGAGSLRAARPFTFRIGLESPLARAVSVGAQAWARAGLAVSGTAGSLELSLLA